MFNKLTAINLIGVILILGIALAAPWNTYSVLLNKLNAFDNIAYKQYAILFLLVILMPLGSNFFLNKSNQISLSKSQTSLLVLFLLFIFSFFWAESNLYYFDKIVLYIISATIIGYVSTIEINERNLEKILFFVSIMGLLVAGVGLFQSFFPKLLPHEVLPFYTWPGPSTFGNKNMASQIVIISYPIAAFLWLKSHNKLYSFVAGISFVLIFAYIYVAISKAAYIALVIENIVLIFYFALNRAKYSIFSLKKLYPVLTALLLLLIVIFLASDYANHRVSSHADITRLASELTGSSQDSRISIWVRGINYFLNSPIYGYGAGNFNAEVVNDGVQHILRKAHNDFIETGVELGLIGLLVLFLFIYYLIKDLILVTKESSLSDFFHIFVISILGISVSVMVSFPLQLVGPLIIVSLFSSLLMFEARKFNTAILKISMPRNQNIKKLFFLIFYILIILSFLFTNRSVNGMNKLYVNSGTHYTNYNPEMLKTNAKITPGFESVLFKFSNDYYEAGYKNRSAEILSFSTNINKKDTFASRRQFEFAIEEKDYIKAEEIVNEMKEFNTYHPVTMLTLLDFYKAKKDINSAKSTYKFYKDYYSNTSLFYDLRAYYYLLMWSVILQEYGDTEGFYSTIKDKFALTPEVENIIAKYYLYTSNIDKAKIKVQKLVDMGETKVIDKVLIDYMKDNNLVVFDK